MKRKFLFRLAEDLSWKIHSRLKWDEKLEFSPRVENVSQYRVRLESNLKYTLLQNLSLILSVIDQYATQPAKSVDNNDLQVRSAIGLKF